MLMLTLGNCTATAVAYAVWSEFHQLHAFLLTLTLISGHIHISLPILLLVLLPTLPTTCHASLESRYNTKQLGFCS